MYAKNRSAGAGPANTVTAQESTCAQKDDMGEVYELLKNADMLVIASPIYYHGISGQLKCAIDRFYAAAYPVKLPA